MVVKSKGLTKKHLRAIDLIMDGHAISEVAKQVGFALKVLYALKAGDTKMAGNVAILFRAELEGREEKGAQEIKNLIKSNQRDALEILQSWLLSHKNADVAKPETIKTIIKSIQALLSSGATTRIGEMHIHEGLTQEDLLDEFKRLKKVAKDAVALRRGVRSAETTGAELLP